MFIKIVRFFPRFVRPIGRAIKAIVREFNLAYINDYTLARQVTVHESQFFRICVNVFAKNICTLIDIIDYRRSKIIALLVGLAESDLSYAFCNVSAMPQLKKFLK